MVARDGVQLDIGDLPRRLMAGGTARPGEIRFAKGMTMKDVERIVIESTLKACGFNKQACAKTLGMGLRTLYRKINDYDLR